VVTRTRRKIIQINEEKCNGCGVCIESCAEGALALVNGKAKLVKEQYCDGLAACLKECPQGALQIVEREAAEFNEDAVKKHLEQKKTSKRDAACFCPGSAVREIERQSVNNTGVSQQMTELSNWPVQLTLVPAGARFLSEADVFLIAQCVPFTYPNFHRDFLKDHAVITACPKLDDADAHLAKLTEIVVKSNLRSLSVVRMEVPCCGGLSYIARKALDAGRIDIPLKEIVVGVDGKIKESNNGS
jgi:Fe-S-cluster-containing hydrogenase component 2